jgi:hypothetical protein
VFHVSHRLTAVILMAVLIVVVLEGLTVSEPPPRVRERPRYQSWPAPADAVKFWDVKGGMLAGNEITNTYNAPKEGLPGSRLMVVEPTTGGISESPVTVEYGDGAPAAPN